MNSRIKLELRANNQISLTKGDWRSKEKCPYTSAYLTNTEIERERDFEENLQKIIDIKRDKREAYLDRKDIYKYRLDQAKNAKNSPLDIILKSQRDKSYPCSKLNTPKSFTKASGQKLRESGAAIDIESKGNTRFSHEITLTLPANTIEAFTALAAKSGYVINRLFQPIRRKYGEMCLWFFVWEYQRRGALHLHICIYHPDECEGLWIAAQIIEQWHKILCDLSEICDTDMFTRKNKKSCTIRANHQHHTAPIEKAVGSYFSKYAGKEESKNNWYCKRYPISRFWGSSKAVKSICKANSAKFDNDYYNEQEAERIHQEIIEKIIEKLSIVSASSYDFAIELKGKYRINHYGNGRKILIHEMNKIIAQGERFTFYFEQSQMELAKSLIHEFYGNEYF